MANGAVRPSDRTLEVPGPRSVDGRHEAAGLSPAASMCDEPGAGPGVRSLDGRADAAEDLRDLPAQEDQGDDRDDRDEREDQRVLGETLALVLALELGEERGDVLLDKRH